MKKISVLVSLIAQMLQFASQKGVFPTDLLELSGIDPKILDHPDNRISIDQYNRIQNNAVALTADENFGIHMGEFALTNSFSIVGFVMMNCKTIGDAIKKAVEYHEIMGNLIQTSWGYDKENIIVTLFPREGSYGHTRHCYEASVSSFVTIMGLLSNGDFELDHIWFSHETPESLREYKRIFKCKVTFNQPKTAVFFHKRNMELPIIQANQDLLPLMERHARKSLGKVTFGNTYTHKATGVLKRFISDPPSISMVAKELAVSVRKLQQKLFEENTSFREILKSTRIKISKDHLRGNRHSVSEIAFLLGFSEPGVFSKAFVKWTGVTPHQYRKRNKNM